MQDELNPELMFQTTRTELLLAIARSTLDSEELARKELANRGLNEKGEWIGFDEAKKIWLTDQTEPLIMEIMLKGFLSDLESALESEDIHADVEILRDNVKALIS